MTWLISADQREYAAVEEFLRCRPVPNFSLLGEVSVLRRQGGLSYADRAPLLLGLWTSQEGAVTGAFVQDPSYRVLLGDMPASAATALADELAGWSMRLPMVSGRRELTEAFTAAWRRRTGATAVVSERQRLYRLGALVPPLPMPEGTARLATTADQGLLEGWYDAITRGHGNPPEWADAWIRSGLVLWDVDENPVAMAGNGDNHSGAVRLDPVYTLPERRRHGYATALVAVVSRSLLDSGADEILHLTNRANDATYQRIGYRPVDDYITSIFH